MSEYPTTLTCECCGAPCFETKTLGCEYCFHEPDSCECDEIGDLEPIWNDGESEVCGGCGCNLITEINGADIMITTADGSCGEVQS